MSHVTFPVLFVSDLVVLPGMVVPLELDESSQAAIDAARASGSSLLPSPGRPRLRGPLCVARRDRVGRAGRPRHVSSGGRLVLKAEQRGRIGSGVTGPGAALWVEVEPVEDRITARAHELAEEYKRLVVAVLGAEPGRSSTRSTR